MSNKQLGNAFERDLAMLLFRKGFWVHPVVPNAAGQQPADLLAIKDGRAYLIDAKVCSGKYFPFKRIEENQRSAMELWKECGNGSGWFAFRIEGDEEVYFISYHRLQQREMLGDVAISVNDIRTSGLTMSDWSSVCI